MGRQRERESERQRWTERVRETERHKVSEREIERGSNIGREREVIG